MMTEGRHLYNGHSTTAEVSQSERERASQIAEQEAGSSTTTNSVTYSRARARAGSSVRLILDEYERMVDDVDRYVVNMIREALEAGIEPDVIRSAIRDTAKARRPSKNYLNYILERYKAEGVLTMEDLIKDKDKFELRINSAKRRRHQKWYDDDTVLQDYDQTFYDEFMEPERYDIDRYLPVQTPEYVKNRRNKLLK